MRLSRQTLPPQLQSKTCSIRWNTTGICSAKPTAMMFVSGLLEDWWRARHGRYFTPIEGSLHIERN